MSNQNTAAILSVPVTGELLACLVEVRQLAERIEDPQSKINDREHFGAVALLLEDLAQRIMRAQSGIPLIHRAVTGARFTVETGSRVAAELAKTIEYLGTEAADVLEHAQSSYDSKNVSAALGRLKALDNAVQSGIVHAAVDDLRDIRDQGPENLVAAADFLWGAATGETGPKSGNSLTAVADKR